MGWGDVTIEEVTKSQEQVDGQTVYKLKFKIRNTTDHAVKFKLADNPWKKDGGAKLFEDDKDSKGDPVKGSARKKALAKWVHPTGGNNDPFELDKKGSGKATAEIVISYSYPIKTTYTDLIMMKGDGTPDDDISSFRNVDWDVLKTSRYFPSGPRPHYACVFKLPYPMVVEQVWDGPINVAIERIEGLPRGYQLLHVYPPIGVPHQLDFADRHSEGVLIVRQLAETGGPHRVRIWYRVVDPADLPVHSERCMEFDIVGIGPPIELRESSVKREIDEGRIV